MPGSGWEVTQPPGNTSTTWGVLPGPWSWKRLTPGATVWPSPVVAAAHVGVSRIVTLPATARARGHSPAMREMSRLAWPSSSTDSPSRTASALMTLAGSAWTQGMWDAEGTACAWSHSSSIWVQPPGPPGRTGGASSAHSLELRAAPAPAGDDGGAAGVGAGAGEQPGQRDGGGKQHQRDHKQERDASRAPALDADRAGCRGEQAHELGGQVAALGAHQLAELGGQGPRARRGGE